MPDDETMRIAAERVGRVLRGKYRLDAVLGAGGMAVVYAATHRNRKRFAIKMLHADISRHEGIRTRFLREGYVANSVGHPGAVAVLDDDVAEDGAAFIVMELLSGRTVEDLWLDHRRRVPLALAMSIGDALLDVLAAAHAKKIVHRDIKPANLFITNDGRLLVLDFGIARLRDDKGGEATATGAMLGTPAFMAPEQALGESTKVDGQTDLWAVGATLFVMLTGKFVHPGENASQLLVNAATKKAPLVQTVVSDLPKVVADVIDRALAFEKGERWPSATEMRKALAKACLDATGSAPPPLPKTEDARALADTVDAGEPFALASGPAFEPTVDASAPAAAGVAKGTGLSTTAAVSSEPIAPAPQYGSAPLKPPSAARAPRWLVIAGLVGALVVVGFVAKSTLVSTAAPTVAPVPSVSAAQSAIGMTEVPMPPSQNGAALTAYRKGLQDFHDASIARGHQGMREALALDPGLGAAHLRELFFEGAADVPVHISAARQLRSGLSPRDQKILQAIEPRYQVPPDFETAASRAATLATELPGDVEVAVVAALTAADLPSRAQSARDALDRALSLDPTLALAHWMKADVSTDVDEKRRELQACVAASPTPGACLRTLAGLEGDTGHCQTAEELMAKNVALEPDGAYAYRMLVGAAVGRGARRRELEGLLDKAELATAKRLAESYARLSLQFGAFNEAQERLLKLTPRRSVLLAALFDETGDVARARQELAGLATTTGLDDLDSSELLFTLRQAARLKTSDAASLETLARSRATSLRSQSRAAWLADIVVAAAGGALPQDSALFPSPVVPDASPALWGEIGGMLLDRGRAELALPFLRIAADGCDPITEGVVVWRPRARLALGEALEKTADVAGACKAFSQVTAQWGSAVPRSVTAERAAARARALRCSR